MDSTLQDSVRAERRVFVVVCEPVTTLFVWLPSPSAGVQWLQLAHASKGLRQLQRKVRDHCRNRWFTWDAQRPKRHSVVLHETEGAPRRVGATTTQTVHSLSEEAFGYDRATL